MKHIFLQSINEEKLDFSIYGHCKCTCLSFKASPPSCPKCMCEMVRSHESVCKQLSQKVKLMRWLFVSCYVMLIAL